MKYKDTGRIDDNMFAVWRALKSIGLEQRLHDLETRLLEAKTSHDTSSS